MNIPLSDDTGRYRRVRDLLDRASERPEAEWASFLDRECPSDPELRAEVMRLLENGLAADTEGFLDPSPLTTEPASETVTHGGAGPSATETAHVGKHRIVRRFPGVSGQGAAYLAFDPDVERHVVLKRYHGASGEAEEARALARVASPYVARCLGIERIEGEAYLVVEYVPGRTLGEVRADGPIELTRLVRIVAQLAEGVAAVHARGLIHRDLKPANVILHDDGTPRLVDFGLAAHLGSPRLRDICGTPSYMAPEQARGEWERIDQRLDVFGLGAVLYKLLTGHPPHNGTTSPQNLEIARRSDITPPRRLDPKIPEPIEAVCLKALAPAPENRHTTALEFAAALRLAIEPTPVVPPAQTRPRLWLSCGPLTAVIAFGVMAIAVPFWATRRSENSFSVDMGARPIAERLLRAEIAVEHYRELGDGKRVKEIGPITAKSLDTDPPLLKDLVRVHVTLPRPSYSYLIALNPDGKDQLCLPAGGTADGPPRSELDFPAVPGEYFSLTDGVGLQAFVVVTSDRPLPAYEAWKATVPGGLAWPRMDGEGFWIYDSTKPSEAERVRGTLRGDTVKRELAPKGLVELCDRLGQTPGVTMVRAVAFPVKPDVEIIKQARLLQPMPFPPSRDEVNHVPEHLPSRSRRDHRTHPGVWMGPLAAAPMRAGRRAHGPAHF